MTKKQEAEITSLNERLTAAGRSLCAHREWFFCATVLRETPAPFEVEGTGMSVMTVGRHRAAGGACLVHVEGKPCGEPVLLDDLCETWGRDPASDIRWASASLLKARDLALRAAS